MTAPPSPTSPDDTTRKADLNLSRVAAAALAAVTAAVVGSKLGAEGTLIGAGAASVVTTVATALYQASLDRSRQRVRSLAHRTRPAAASKPSGRSRRLSRLSWGAVVVGAFGGFTLAMMAITGFEWASGGTVGDNGKGTTIGQVVNDQSGPQKPTLPPASPGPAGPTSETPAEPTESSEPPTTSTTAPNGGDGNEQSPTPTANRSRPSEVTPPPLIPGLPGVGG
jgi:hypothetical protein